MDTTIDQQVAMDEALVRHAKRLRIERSLSDIKSKESTLQLVYDVLRLTPFFKAFLVTADVLKIHMQEFWVTATVYYHAIRFKMDNKKHIVNLESFSHISSHTTNINFNHKYQHSILLSMEHRIILLIFQKGDDPVDAMNHMMSFLTAVVTSQYPPTNNQLRTSSNPRQQATINNRRVTIQLIQGRQNSMTVDCDELNSAKIALVANLSHYGSDNLAESLEIKNLKHSLSEHLKEKESLEQKVTLLKNDFQKEESQNIDRELALEKQETLLLEDESRSKMFKKQKDPMMSKKKLNKLFWSHNSWNSKESNLSSSTTIVEVPKELLKVGMVNSSLKKLKFHLASFDM
nr:hypothetical protein [Tanacetum cinerariifolium]